MEREVDLPRAETADNVAAKIAVAAGGWNRKRGAIEGFAAWKTWFIEIQGLAGHNVRPVTMTIGDEIGRQRGSGEKDAVCGPVAEE